MWVATQDLPRSAAHPFHARLNQILDKVGFPTHTSGVIPHDRHTVTMTGTAAGRGYSRRS